MRKKYIAPSVQEDEMNMECYVCAASSFDPDINQDPASGGTGSSKDDLDDWSDLWDL